MWCPRCKHENPDGARFCLHCGAQLAASCAGCGAAQPPGARFCPECGRAAVTVPNPASYTPRHISEQILAVRGAIEGERKQVSVLFCDIVASSALAAELGPEEFHLVIDRFFRVALAEVQRYEGTIQPGHWSTARSMPGTQARPPKPQVCSAARYARRATLGTCEGTRHEGVGNDD